jgi:hypothetical protein
MHTRVTRLIAILILLNQTSWAQRLEPFGSGGNKKTGMNARSIPYENTLFYFECINDNNDFLVKDGKKEAYVMYFFLEDSLQEIGLRVLSPIPELVSPNRGHIVTANYLDSCDYKEKGFDPVLKISRSKKQFSRTELSQLETKPEFILLGENDNNDEMNVKENALIRLQSNADSLNLSPGLYSISISSATKNPMRGNFLLQIGTVPATRISPLSRDWRDL